MFVASTVESLPIAKAIQLGLDHVADVEVWDQGAFAPGSNTLQSLIDVAKRTDLAVVVLQADDLVTTRGAEAATARDNVVLELGIFLGSLGPERALFLFDRDHPPKLPTDLAGITPVTYSRHATGNLQASLGAACTAIGLQLADLPTSRAVGSEFVTLPKDRIYLTYHSLLWFDASEDEGYWSATERGRRRFRALQEIPRWTYNLTRRSDDDMPFSEHPPQIRLIDRSRTQSGDITMAADPRKATANLTFDVVFDPPLRPGEETSFDFEVLFPRHKAARVDEIRKRPRPKVPVPGGGEYSSCDVSFPVEDFRYEAHIPRDLGSRDHGCQALARGAVNREEQVLIDNREVFTDEVRPEDGRDHVVLAVHRSRPPLGLTYRLYWQPDPSI